MTGGFHYVLNQVAHDYSYSKLPSGLTMYHSSVGSCLYGTHLVLIRSLPPYCAAAYETATCVEKYEM